MREIDFRMWDSTTKKYFHDPMNVFECLKQQSFYDKKLGFLAYNHIDGGCVFEQYTGLKDKNRVKIFEGDIVRITNSESQIQKMEATGAVSITPLGPMIENIHWHRIDGYINHQKTGTIYFINIVGTRIIEIIGNIHDNPEMVNP